MSEHSFIYSPGDRPRLPCWSKARQITPLELIFLFCSTIAVPASRIWDEERMNQDPFMLVFISEIVIEETEPDACLLTRQGPHVSQTGRQRQPGKT